MPDGREDATTSIVPAASQPNSPSRSSLPAIAGTLDAPSVTAKLVDLRPFQAPCATTLGHIEPDRSVITPMNRLMPTTAP